MTDLLNALQNVPRVREMNAGRLRGNVAASAERLGMPVDAFCGLARRCPPLVYQRPESLAAKAAYIVVLFRLTPKELRRVIKRRPSLLTHSTSFIYRASRELTTVIGLNPMDARRVAVRAPQVLTLDPHALAAKRERHAVRFGKSKEEVARMCGQCPGLLTLSPERIWANVEATAEQLGVPIEIYLPLALRHAPGLVRLPQSRVKVWIELQRLAQTCGHADDIVSVLTTVPAALSYSPTSIASKRLARELGVIGGTLGRVLTTPNAKVTNALGTYAACHGGQALWRRWRQEGLVRQRRP